MRGYNSDPLPERKPENTTPIRFKIQVLVHDEAPKSRLLEIPQSAFDLQEHTRGRHGTVISMGPLAHGSMTGEGLIEVGSHIVFDESVSIDDPHRCTKYDGDLHIVFGIDTVIAVIKPLNKQNCEEGLKKRKTLAAIGKSLVWILGDRVAISRPVIYEQTTKAGIVMPVGDWLKKVGGVHLPGGKYARHTGGVIEAAGLGIIDGVNADGEYSRRRMDVEVGDVVVFPKYGYTDITIDDVPCVIMQQDKILAKIKPTAEEQGAYERKGEAVTTDKA